MFRDKNSLSRLLLFPIHLKSVVGGLSEETQYQKLTFDFFSHLYFWLLESDVPGTLCSVTFLKHLIPFPIKTRQEESSRRKKISLEQIESIWGVFCCESGDDPEVIHELSLILSACFLRAQEWFIPSCRKWSKSCTKSALMNEELLVELKHGKEVYKRWKQGQMSQEWCKDTVHVCRGWVQKATLYLKLNLVSEIQNESDRIKPSFWEVPVGEGHVAYCI